MTYSPTLRAIQAEAAPHMERCGTLKVISTQHERERAHQPHEDRDVVVPRVRRADPHAARAALLRMSDDDVAAGLERWIAVACRAAGCEVEELQGFGKGRGHMPRDTSAVRAEICWFANRHGVQYKALASRFRTTKDALIAATKSARQRRQRQEVEA